MRDRGVPPRRHRLPLLLLLLFLYLILIFLPLALLPAAAPMTVPARSCSMNRGHEERRAFLDYRGRDLLVLKRVIMRYKTTVRRTRSRCGETAGDYAKERPDSLFLLRRRGCRFRNRDAHTCARTYTRLSTSRGPYRGEHAEKARRSRAPTPRCINEVTGTAWDRREPEEGREPWTRYLWCYVRKIYRRM